MIRALAAILVAFGLVLASVGPASARGMPMAASAIVAAGCGGQHCSDHRGAPALPMTAGCMGVACGVAVGLPVARSGVSRTVATVAGYHPLAVPARRGELPEPAAPPPRLR